MNSNPTRTVESHARRYVCMPMQSVCVPHTRILLPLMFLRKTHVCPPQHNDMCVRSPSRAREQKSETIDTIRCVHTVTVALSTKIEQSKLGHKSSR